PAAPAGRGPAVRVAALEALARTREAVRDVGARDTARVERPHRQLRPGLADRLRGDDPDRVADLAHPAGRQEDAVAAPAHAELAAALEHRADWNRRLLLELVLGEGLLDVGQELVGDDVALLADDRLARLAARARPVDLLRLEPTS